MFIIEHPVDPKRFFKHSCCWVVGGADPNHRRLRRSGPYDSAWDEVLAVIAMFLGIATFAIPIAIVGAGFTEAFEARRSGQGQAQAADPCKLLGNLADLKEQGVITEEEFAAKKQELLARL